MLLVGEEGLFTLTQILLLSPSFTQSFQDIFMNVAGGRGRIVYINLNSSSLPFLHPELRYFHEWERKRCTNRAINGGNAKTKKVDFLNYPSSMIFTFSKLVKMLSRGYVISS
jgi:hypothetical protein